MGSESLEERCFSEEVDWRTAWNTGLRKQFLPFGLGVYYLQKDLNNGKPTFSGSMPYHVFLSFVPIVAALYGLSKLTERLF